MLTLPLWKQIALVDRRRIIAHIANDKPLAAVEFGDLLMEKANQLDQHPNIGRVGRIQGTRELVVHPNYLLIYRVVGQIVEVLRVKHAAQQLP